MEGLCRIVKGATEARRNAGTGEVEARHDAKEGRREGGEAEEKAKRHTGRRRGEAAVDGDAGAGRCVKMMGWRRAQDSRWTQQKRPRGMLREDRGKR